MSTFLFFFFLLLKYQMAKVQCLFCLIFLPKNPRVYIIFVEIWGFWYEQWPGWYSPFPIRIIWKWELLSYLNSNNSNLDMCPMAQVMLWTPHSTEHVVVRGRLLCRCVARGGNPTSPPPHTQASYAAAINRVQHTGRWRNQDDTLHSVTRPRPKRIVRG